MGIILLRYYGKQKYTGRGTYLRWDFKRRPIPYAQGSVEHFQDPHTEERPDVIDLAAWLAYILQTKN